MRADLRRRVALLHAPAPREHEAERDLVGHVAAPPRAQYRAGARPLEVRLNHLLALADACPWSWLAPANLDFCEADVCGWVAQPANTVSNLAFVLVAAWVSTRARRARQAALVYLGLLALATGLASAAFHATGSLAGQLADQNVMLAESGLFVALNVARWRRTFPRGWLAVHLVVVLVPVALLVAAPTLGIALFAAHVVVFLGLELALWRREPGHIRYGALVGVGVTFVLSITVWWLDERRILCDPDNHIFNGHALWHLLGAASFVFWYRHYAQLYRPLDRPDR